MLRCEIDLIEIDRIERGIERFGERFLNQFFTAGERADTQDRADRLAARLAAKEAVAKALGTGIGTVGWRDIEIRGHESSGRPLLTLHGPAAEAAAELGLTEWDLSLTHTDQHASAVAVAL